MISDTEPRSEETFPDDILQAAEDIMRSVISRAEFHSVVRANEAWDKGRYDIAKALMAERQRWYPAAEYFWRYCQDEAEGAEDAGCSQKQHEDALDFRIVVNNSGF
jgi:hypothetical protein